MRGLSVAGCLAFDVKYSFQNGITTKTSWEMG